MLQAQGLWQAVSDFAVSHWKPISLGTVGSAAGIIGRSWTQYKQRDTKKLSRKLRAFGDEVKRKEPNIFAFSRPQLARHLGLSDERTLEVLEYMEEKRWAAKVRFPADYWQIN